MKFSKETETQETCPFTPAAYFKRQEDIGGSQTVEKARVTLGQCWYSDVHVCRPFMWSV